MKLTKRQLDRASRLYVKGQTLREIGVLLGVDNAELGKALRSAGVHTRRRGPRGRTDVTDDQIREARDDLRLSFREVAAMVGMSFSGVKGRYRVMNGLSRYR